MRVELVTETFPPEINGVALTVQSMEEGLAALGHKVGVVRPRQRSDAARGNELLVPGCPLPSYPQLRFGLPASRKLHRRWAAQRPDVVYVATEGPLGWSATRAALRLGIPFATGLHTRFDHYMRHFGLRALEPAALAWMRHFHNRSGATLVPTCELADFLRDKGFDRVVHLPRAVDTERFNPCRRNEDLRASWGAGREDLVAIVVGRVSAEKNLPLAIDAFRAIAQQQPRARLVVVGDGPELARLKVRHPDLTYLGEQRGDDVARAYASADLVLFPSLSETFGNITLEAMASGVPTVAFDYGAAREYLRHGLHGACLGTDDPAAFVDAAVRVAKLPRVIRTTMGLEARGAVSHLHPGLLARDLERGLRMLRVELPDHALVRAT